MKKIAHALPGNQSKRSRASAQIQPLNLSPMTNPCPWEIYAGPLSPNSIEDFSFPRKLPRKSATTVSPLPTPVLDISRRNHNPPINLNSITPSSSYDESLGLDRDASGTESVDIRPFSSSHIMTDTEGTAVNEVIFPTSDPTRLFNVPPLPPIRSMRLRSMSDAPQNIRFPPESLRPPPRTDAKTLLALEGKSLSNDEGPSKRNGAEEDNKYKRGRRITIDTTSRNQILRRPISRLGTSNISHSRTYSSCREEVNTAPKSMPPSDPFNSLFASCALSLFLLIVLAAGKDVLYIVALLPVVMALGKHFLDLDNLGQYTPLTRKSLESLISF